MDILQIGDIVRIKPLTDDDRHALDYLPGWCHFASANKRESRVGQYGYVVELTRMGISNVVRALVVPHDNPINFLTDRGRVLYKDGFYTVQTQLELVRKSPLRESILSGDVPKRLERQPIPTLVSPIPEGTKLDNCPRTPKSAYCSRIADGADGFTIEVDTTAGYVGSLRIPYDALIQPCTTF